MRLNAVHTTCCCTEPNSKPKQWKMHSSAFEWSEPMKRQCPNLPRSCMSLPAERRRRSEESKAACEVETITKLASST
eukprot:678736-Pleurochrysis_carterae.AAC.4